MVYFNLDNYYPFTYPLLKGKAEINMRTSLGSICTIKSKTAMKNPLKKPLKTQINPKYT